MKNLIIRKVPDDLHRKFRVYCLEHDISMNKMIIKLIAQTVGAPVPISSRKDKAAGARYKAPASGTQQIEVKIEEEPKKRSGLELAAEYRKKLEAEKTEDLEEL